MNSTLRTLIRPPPLLSSLTRCKPQLTIVARITSLLTLTTRTTPLTSRSSKTLVEGPVVQSLAKSQPLCLGQNAPRAKRTSQIVPESPVRTPQAPITRRVRRSEQRRRRQEKGVVQRRRAKWPRKLDRRVLERVQRLRRRSRLSSQTRVSSS